MLVTVVTLVTIENVYHMIITSVEPHNGNCGDIHNFFAFLTILLFLVIVVTSILENCTRNYISLQCWYPAVHCRKLSFLLMAIIHNVNM